MLRCPLQHVESKVRRQFTCALDILNKIHILCKAVSCVTTSVSRLWFFICSIISLLFYVLYVVRRVVCCVCYLSSMISFLHLLQKYWIVSFSRRNPMKLLVALGDNNTAQGDLFWDDGESIGNLTHKTTSHTFTFNPFKYTFSLYNTLVCSV